MTDNRILTAERLAVFIEIAENGWKNEFTTEDLTVLLTSHVELARQLALFRNELVAAMETITEAEKDRLEFRQQLASERVLRLTAEGREAALRTAARSMTDYFKPIHALDDRLGDGEGFDMWEKLVSALDAPDHGAGAVLAAADDWLDGGTSDGDLADAVITWRAARVV